MKTVSNREFAANLDLYMGMAQKQDVRIRRGRRVYHLTCEPAAHEQPILEPDDKLRNAITFDELLVGVHEDISRKWAERRKR